MAPHAALVTAILPVLIPSRTNLRRLERAFGQQHVPYRIESGWLVLHTQEVRDLLRACGRSRDPSDQVALVAALRSPAYGLLRRGPVALGR